MNKRFAAPGAVVVAVLVIGAIVLVLQNKPDATSAPGSGPAIDEASEPPGCRGAAALQKRINAAKPGATITLSGSVCLVTRIEIDDKLGLTIEGDGTAVLKQDASNTDKILSVASSKGVTLRRLEIAGASASSGNRSGAYSEETAQSAALALKGVSDFVLEQSFIHDVYGDFVDIDQGPDDQFSINVTIRGNRFERSGRQGISTGKNVRDVLIADNTISDVRLAAIDLEPGTSDATTSGVKILNNQAINYRTYFLSVGGVGELSDVLVRGNKSQVAGGKNGGLAFVFIGKRREDRPPVTKFVMCENTGDLVEENTLGGALDPVTTCP